MNNIKTAQSLERWIDRLVDGELSDADRRELLSRLETEPGGWRACALAFLEAQTWSEAIGSPSDSLGAARSSIAMNSSNMIIKSQELSLNRIESSRGKGFSRVARSAWAAGLIAMFAIGAASGFTVGKSRGSHSLATVAKKSEPAIPKEQTNSDAKIAEANAAVSVSAYRTVAFASVIDLDSGEETTPAPVVAGPEIDLRALLERPSAIPDYVKSQWEREGYRVEEKRKVLALRLADGGRCAIPIDQVNYRYVGLEVH